MKKILFGILLLFAFSLSSCDFGEKEDTVVYHEYEMEINTEFETIYKVNSEIPVWEDGLIIKRDGEIYGSTPGNVDSSSVDMTTVGTYQLRYYYYDPETRDDISIYLDITIIERDDFIKRFDAVYSDSFHTYIELDDGYIGYGYGMFPAGNNDYNTIVIRLDSEFNVLWYSAVGGGSHEYPVDIIVKDDLYYISIQKDTVAEILNTTLLNEAQFLILNDEGETLYKTSYSRIGEDLLPGFSTTSDGGVIAVGTYIDEYVDTDYENDTMFAWIIKYDATLNIDFDILFDFSSFDNFEGVLETVNNDYLVWGDVRVNDSGDEGYLALVNNLGEITNSISLFDTFSGNKTDIIDVIEDELGNIYVFGNLNYTGMDISSGTNSPNIFVAKFDSDLVLLDSYTIETDDIDIMQRVDILNNGNYLVSGVNSSTNSGEYTLFYLEMDNSLAEVDYEITDYVIKRVENVVQFSNDEYVITITDYTINGISRHHLFYNTSDELIGDKTFSNDDIGHILRKTDGTYLFMTKYDRGAFEFDTARINGTDGIVIEFDLD